MPMIWSASGFLLARSGLRAFEVVVFIRDLLGPVPSAGETEAAA